jgi:hypothetical protein
MSLFCPPSSCFNHVSNIRGGSYNPTTKYLDVGFNGIIRHSNIYKPIIVFQIVFCYHYKSVWTLFVLETWKVFFIGQANVILLRWLAYCWMFKITFVIFGNVIWSYELWVAMIKFYYKKSVMENSYLIHKTYDQQKIDFNEVFIMFCHFLFVLLEILTTLLNI